MMKLFIMSFNKDMVMDALNIAWKGFLALFIAMFIIFLLILVLNHAFKPRKKNE